MTPLPLNTVIFYLLFGRISYGPILSVMTIANVYDNFQGNRQTLPGDDQTFSTFGTAGVYYKTKDGIVIKHEDAFMMREQLIASLLPRSTFSEALALQERPFPVSDQVFRNPLDKATPGQQSWLACVGGFILPTEWNSKGAALAGIEVEQRRQAARREFSNNNPAFRSTIIDQD